MESLKTLVILLMLKSTVGSDELEPLKCCKNDANLLLEIKCAPDSNGKTPKLPLACEDRYMLNPRVSDEDFYNITENATLFMPSFESDNPVYLFHDEYCLANSFDKDANETYEIAIVCFKAEPEIAKIQFEIKAILMFTSIVFLLITLYIYFILEELRETQDKVMINTLICITTFMFSLALMQVYIPLGSDICLLLGISTYFFSMSYFAWLNCVIVNVWKSVVLRRWEIKESVWYFLNHLYAWTVSIALTTIVLYKHLIEPTLGVHSCWFHHRKNQYLMVYLPISIMLLINVIFSVWSGVFLSHTNYTQSTIKALKYKCILYLKIFLLGGFTWIFEVLSFIYNEHEGSAWVWIIFDAINCLHGFLIFCVLIWWRKKIKKELANRRILCFTCPSKWADIYDEEEVCLDEANGKYDLVFTTLK